MDICVQVFVWTYVSILLDLYLGEAPLGQTPPLLSEDRRQLSDSAPAF